MENELREALKRMGQKREIKGRVYVTSTGQRVIVPNALFAPYDLSAAFAPLTDRDLELAAFDEIVRLPELHDEKKDE